MGSVVNSHIVKGLLECACDFFFTSANVWHSYGWLGSRVVSVLDSGAEGPKFNRSRETLSGNSLRQTVHTHCASVHRAAKLVAALLRVAGGNCGPGGKYWQPTAGFMTHVTCRLTAKNRDQLRKPRLGNRVWASFTFTFICCGICV